MVYLIINFVGSGKAQNVNEAKRLRERIPSAIGRGFKDRHGALLLVSSTAVTSFCLVLSQHNFASYIPMSVEIS